MSTRDPEPGTINIMFRPSPKGSVWIEELRRKHDVKRTDVVREALAIASLHQPDLEQRLRMLKEKF